MMNKLTTQTFGYAGKIGLIAFIPYFILQLVSVILARSAVQSEYDFVFGILQLVSFIVMLVPSLWLAYSIHSELFSTQSYKNWALPYKKSQIIRSKALPVIVVVSALMGLTTMTEIFAGYLDEAVYGSVTEHTHYLSDMNAGLLAFSMPAYYLTLFLFSNVLGSCISLNRRKVISLLVFLIGTVVFITGATFFNAIRWKYAHTYVDTEILIISASSLLIVAIVTMSLIIKDLADKKLDIA